MQSMYSTRIITPDRNAGNVALPDPSANRRSSKTAAGVRKICLLRLVYLMVFLACTSSDARAQPARNSQEVWPAIDMYYRFNPRFRLYGTVAATKLDESSYSDGAVGLFADFFSFPLVKFFHPLYRADSLPGKYLWFRTGYQYSGTPSSSEDPFKESMIVTEANARFFLPHSMLLSLKNRFDWRFGESGFSARYRPRLTLERDFRTEFLFFTASGFAEYYANFGNPSVNRLKTQIGVEIRVLKHLNYEAFWNHQFANDPEIEDVEAFGMTLKIYLDKGDQLFWGKLKKKPPKDNVK